MPNQESWLSMSAGRFKVRLAEGQLDIEAAQSLRYKVFYEEMHAIGSDEATRRKLDFDEYDPICDHLLAIDQTSGFVVGNYRLLRQEVAQAHFGFYSQTEFDLTRLLLSVPQGLLEVGRACVHPEYRRATLMMLLWSGIAAYVERYGIKYMFGCGSFPGTDPDTHARTLRSLYEDHLAPEHLRVRALPQYYESMERDVSPSSSGVSPILPPLIEGYLKLSNAYVGDGAVVDQSMNTTDIFILVSAAGVLSKYRNHFLRSRP